MGGLFGIGGGLIAIPVLGVFYGLDEQHAQGTSIAMVMPNVAVGIWQYARRAKMDLRVAFALAGAAAPCTYFAARIAVRVSSTDLRRAFAAFLLALAVYYAFRALRGAAGGKAVELHLERWPAALGIGALGGILSGLFAVGGAVFAVPLLVFTFGFPQAVAQGFGLALVFPGTIVSLLTYAAANDVVWKTGIVMAIGGMAAIGQGVGLAHRLPERTMRLLFVLLCGVSAIALWVRA